MMSGYAIGTWSRVGSTGTQYLFYLILPWYFQQHEIICFCEACVYLTQENILGRWVKLGMVEQMRGNIRLKCLCTTFMTFNNTCWSLQFQY